MAGRPTSYKPEYAEQAVKLCQLGATDAELADFFKVTTVTIWRWQSAHEEFCNALTRGKQKADERVERSLYARATGYTFDAVKIFMPAGAKKPIYAEYQEHVPPDTTAMIFWLKNRQPELWRDKTEHVVRHELSQMSDDDLARIAAGGSKGVASPPVHPEKLN